MRTEKEKKASKKNTRSPRSSARRTSTGPSPARKVAHEVLCTLERAERFADELLDDAQADARLDARDRRLCMELTYGVLRRQASLDWRLNHVTDRPVARLPVPVRVALRLGAYQLLHLDKIPPSAAVHESVTLAAGRHDRASVRWAGLTNAVLRALTRHAPPALPDCSTDPVRALAVRASCPAWLVERWLARYGDSLCEQLCQATLLVPPLTLRTNILKGTREDLLAKFFQAGLLVRPTPISPVGVILEKQGAVTELPHYQEGLYYVEDEAAQLVPPLLDPQPGERVLDACAAPGGKSTHLAEIMENSGEIIAVDRSEARLRLLRENCARLGISIVRPLEHDWCRPAGGSRNAALDERSFDCALVDAPCSGLGVLKRHPEAKWQRGAALLAGHHARQLSILDQVASLLRPGGRLVYSTCSTEPEENEYVIEQFCSNYAEFQRESIEPWLPEGRGTLLTSQGYLSTLTSMPSMDAFFACRLRKAGPS